MVKIKEAFAKIKNKIPYKNKRFIFTCVLLLVCILVLIIGFPLTKTEKNKPQETTKITFDVLAYANEVSDELEQIINQIKGIANAKVVVVVSQSPQVEYLTEKTSSGITVVYNKNGAISTPMVVTEVSPKITGILVVAKGVSNLQLKNNLLNAISAVYNVNISCIDILEGK